MLQKLNSVKDCIFNRVGKKPLIYLGIIVVFLVLFLIWYYYLKISNIPETFLPEKSAKEILIEQQLKELETLRGETHPLTEEEIQTQLKELEKLRLKTKPFSQEEIQK